MTTLQEALPCPFCGKQHTLQVISGQELMGEDQEFWQHSESFGVVCDASTPDGKGGCGAMGGFKPTEDEAIEAWNTRTALAQQDDSLQAKYLKSELAHTLAQQAATKNCPQPEICGSKECEFCRDTAAPAPLAQQGEPVAYITETEQGPMVWTPEMYGEACTYCDDGEFPVPLYTAAPAPVEQRCTYCDGTGDVHSIDGEWRGTCHCAAAPAPQPAQGEPVYQYQKADGSWIDQIKDSYDYNRKYAPNATVRVVYTAADMLQSAQPKQEPLTDDQIIDLENGVARRVGSRRALTIGFARAIEAAHGINGMVEAATRPAIDAASKQGGQHE